jgi:hypothetical protein
MTTPAPSHPFAALLQILAEGAHRPFVPRRHLILSPAQYAACEALGDAFRCPGCGTAHHVRNPCPQESR